MFIRQKVAGLVTNVALKILEKHNAPYLFCEVHFKFVRMVLVVVFSSFGGCLFL